MRFKKGVGLFTFVFGLRSILIGLGIKHNGRNFTYQYPIFNTVFYKFFFTRVFVIRFFAKTFNGIGKHFNDFAAYGFLAVVSSHCRQHDCSCSAVLNVFNAVIRTDHINHNAGNFIGCRVNCHYGRDACVKLNNMHFSSIVISRFFKLSIIRNGKR